MSVFAKSNPERDTAVMLGDPKKAILVTVIPFLISTAIGQINMLADVAWCSVLGSEIVSAVQSVNPLYWVVFDVGLGIGLGCNVIIAHRIGFGDREGAKRIISQGIVLSIVIALAIAPLLFLLIAPMLSFMGAPELTDLSTQYLTPVLAFNVFQVLSPTLSGFLRGEGASNKSNYALVAGTLVNIVLDPVLMFGLNMGVTGAGLATAMSGVVSVLIMLYFYLSKRTTIPLTFKGYRFDRKDTTEILYLGLPKMAEMFLMDTLDAFNRTFLIACGGVDAITMFSVPFRLVILVAMIPNAFAMALTPVASANIGAGKPENSAYAFRLCMKYALAIAGTLVVAFLVFAPYLLMLFTTSESMMALKPELEVILRITIFMAPMISITMVCNSMLQSMKKPMVSLVITTFRTVFTTIAFAALSGTSVALMCVGMVAVGIVSAALAIVLTRGYIKKLIGRKTASVS